MSMPLTVFFVFCILGCDFMIVVLFQWLYGEKRREQCARSASRKHAMPSETPLHYVLAKGSSQRNVACSKLPARLGPRLITESGASVPSALRNERLAYQRIAASL